MMAPPMIHATMPSGMSPPVFCRMVWALKNTPEPMTIPTTMQMAVNKPYFLCSFPLIKRLRFFLIIVKEGLLHVNRSFNGRIWVAGKNMPKVFLCPS